mgnify:CR=1 FL=1
MQIPDSPEDFLEQISEPQIRAFFVNYDDAPVPLKKLARLIHAEVRREELSDFMFKQLLILTVVLWRQMNGQALQNMAESAPKGGLSQPMLEALRIDQYTSSILAVVASFDPTQPTPDNPVHYHYDREDDE